MLITALAAGALLAAAEQQRTALWCGGIALIYFAALWLVFGLSLPMIRFDRMMVRLERTSAPEESHPIGDRYLSRRVEALVRHYRGQVDREYSTRILNKQVELDILQSQINPHFLYNTLESIRGRAMVEESEEIADMAECLASLLRYSISPQGDIVTLGEELKNLETYIRIQQFRFKNRFDIQYSCENEELLGALVPRMMVQPIVENSIYHGLETKLGRGRIQITVEETQSRIELSVEDNGVGIGEERLTQLNRSLSQGGEDREGMGIALLNVHRRLRLHYGENYGVKIFSSEGEGTEVRLTIPKALREAES